MVNIIKTNWIQKKIHLCCLLALILLACATTPQTWELSLPSSVNKGGKPIDIEPDQAAQIGQEALEKFGYENIFNLAVQAGLLLKKDNSDSNTSEFLQISLALEGRTFSWVFSRYAVSAGIASQLDSPAPGPADVVALGILVVGLIDAGLLDGSLISYMTARGRVADTGVEEALQALMGSAAGSSSGPLNRCDALDILMEQAHKAGDTALKKKIVATQKFYKCRGSRSF